jgi:rare lipoprotein A
MNAIRHQLVTFSILFILTGFQQPESKEAQYKQIGIASYYHSKFNGRKTSSGQIFNNDSLTAAHKTLPFGTKVLVRNLKNDSFVTVRINDRLPSASKRIIDLSVAAARKLNFIRAGLVKVSIEKIE